MADFDFLTPEQAWTELLHYRERYYRKYVAAYNGDHAELAVTSMPGLFWKRPGKCKVHMPLAADIAATSADMLFSEEPQFTCYHEATEDNESEQQKRLDYIVSANNIHGKLNEGAESCAALGDVYAKLNWRQQEVPYPILSIVQGDSAWPEYMLGVLQCIHFFSIIRHETDTDAVYRLYERYERGKIISMVYKGQSGSLGAPMGEATLRQLGIEPETITPIDEMLAVHIPNIRPNRKYRDSWMGRSDFDELRDMMDSLDEVYSSWMRDIRLAKARLIVPAEYLRRKPSDMFNGENKYTYEFDEDVETLVALDINTDAVGQGGITPSQFAIRAAEHAATCLDLMRNIVSIAGYAPQSFGMDINGLAQSGTALHIREKKSFNTRGKKQTYWKSPLEQIMTTMIHLDAALFPGANSHAEDTVKVRFADSMANDLSTMSSALQMLNSAAAVSTEMKVQMLHPDWTQKQIAEEVERVKTEAGLNVANPDMLLGDYEALQQEQPVQSEEGAE